MAKGASTQYLFCSDHKYNTICLSVTSMGPLNLYQSDKELEHVHLNYLKLVTIHKDYFRTYSKFAVYKCRTSEGDQKLQSTLHIWLLSTKLAST